MAVELSAPGLMARTNAEIRDAARRHHARKARGQGLRAPIFLIDRMLDDLEALNLRKVRRVPVHLESRLQEIRGSLRDVPCVSTDLEYLKVRIGVLKLMDTLYDLQDALLAAQRRRQLHPDDLDGDEEVTGGVESATRARAIPRLRLIP